MLLIGLLVFVWVIAFPMTAGAVSAPEETQSVTDGGTLIEETQTEKAPAEENIQESLPSEEIIEDLPSDDRTETQTEEKAAEETEPSPEYEVFIPQNLDIGNILSLDTEEDFEVSFEISAEVSEGAGVDIKVSSVGDAFLLKEKGGKFEDITFKLYAGEKEILPGDFICEDFAGTIELKMVIEKETLEKVKIVKEKNTNGEFFADIEFTASLHVNEDAAVQ